MDDIARDTALPRGTIVSERAHKRVSWGAIFGGLVFALAVQMSLSLLGAGVGLSTVNVNSGDTPSAASLGLGAGLWWVISSCIALFAGGYAAAWLAGNKTKFDGMLHGLITWSVATLATVYMLTSAVGGLVGGGFSAVSSVTSSAGNGIKSAAAPVANSVGISPDMLQQQAQAYLHPTNTNAATMSPQDAQKEIAQNLYTYERGGPDADAAKGRIIDISAAQMKVSRNEAAKKFDDAQAKLKETVDQAKQKASDTADAAASGASKTSFALFVGLLLGAIAAAFGGATANDSRTEIERRFAQGRQVGV